MSFVPLPCTPSRFLDCETDSISVCTLDGPLSVTGNLFIDQPTLAATTTTIPASATSVTLLAANPIRKRAIFFNDSTQTAWVKFGSVASNASFSVRLLSQTFYELAFPYIGVIDAAWQSASGNMRVTEFS